MDIEIDGITGAITDALKTYGDEVNEYIREKVDNISVDVDSEIRAHITFGGTGKYLKAFRLKTTKDETTNKEVTWYVKAPLSQLTYLLERGHQKQNGGRTRSFPHIKYGQLIAEKRMAELEREAISD